MHCISFASAVQYSSNQILVTEMKLQTYCRLIHLCMRYRTVKFSLGHSLSYIHHICRILRPFSVMPISAFRHQDRCQQSSSTINVINICRSGPNAFRMIDVVVSLTRCHLCFNFVLASDGVIEVQWYVRQQSICLDLPLIYVFFLHFQQGSFFFMLQLLPAAPSSCFGATQCGSRCAVNMESNGYYQFRTCIGCSYIGAKLPYLVMHCHHSQ